jgi:hypothetical protein
LPPPPRVNPSAIRQTYFDLAEELGRNVTAAEVAERISRREGVEISPSAVRNVVHRYGWTDLPKAGPGANRRGPNRTAHYKTHYWMLITAWERVQAGMADPGGLNAVKARNLVEALLEYGDVLDYSESEGFFVRPRWPWEAGDYLAKRERPKGWAKALRKALRDPEEHLSEEHTRMWSKELLDTLGELG